MNEQPQLRVEAGSISLEKVSVQAILNIHVDISPPSKNHRDKNQLRDLVSHQTGSRRHLREMEQTTFRGSGSSPTPLPAWRTAPEQDGHVAQAWRTGLGAVGARRVGPRSNRVPCIHPRPRIIVLAGRRSRASHASVTGGRPATDPPRRMMCPVIPREATPATAPPSHRMSSEF